MRSSAPTRSNLPELLETRRLLSAVAADAVAPLVTGATAVDATVKGTGVTGEYFIGDNFQSGAVVRTDATINFNWPSGRPDGAIPKGSFSARWTGIVQAPTTGAYTFYTTADSGTQVIVNGTTVIDNLTARTASTQQGTVSLTAGQPVSIQVEYISKGSSGARMKLLWSALGVRQQVVPKSALFPANNVTLPGDQALVGSYYTGFNFKKELLTRVEASPSINFNYGIGGVPDSVIRTDEPFSVRWAGNIVAPTTGEYVFETITDDGVRLYVNGEKIIHDWNVQSAKSNIGLIDLVAGQSYPVTMEYFQDGAGHGSAQLLWALTGDHRQLKFVQFTAPATLTAPQDLTATAFSTTQIDLSWEDVANETGFTVERSADNGVTFNAVGTTAEGVTTFSDTGLTPGTPYVYEIVATNSSGTGPASNEADATTATAIPAAVVASASLSGTTATITWTAVTGATSYLVEVSPDGTTGWTTVGTTSGTNEQATGLLTGTSYFYRVTASNSTGSAAPSNVVSVTTAAAAPTLAATVASDTQINLSWNDVTGETGFIIQESSDGSTNWNHVATTPQGTTMLNVPGLTGGTTYHYRVIAKSAGGNSSPSNVSTATTTTPAPTYASLTTLYGLTNNATVYSINTTTGAATQIGTLSFGTYAAGRDPISGNFYYLSYGSNTTTIASWNPTTGDNSVINSSVTLDGSGTVALAAFRDNGVLYAATSVGDLYAIDRTTGNATLKGTLMLNGSALATANGDLAFGPDGNLYVFTNGNLYETSDANIDAATGSGSNIPVTLQASPNLGTLQIAFGENATLYGESTTGQLYSGTAVNGPATPIGSPSGVAFNDLASVPLNADLSISQTASTFTKGQTGTYTVNITNSGPDATVGPVQVIDTLPLGLSFVSGSGAGWSFNVNGSQVIMTYNGTVHNGALPAATLTVQIASSVTSPVVNSMSVNTTIFDQDTSNNTSTISTNVN